MTKVTHNRDIGVVRVTRRSVGNMEVTKTKKTLGVHFIGVRVRGCLLGLE
jgi:hypothetical protein